jgi:DNA-binding response OmpR family regulator
MNDIKHERVLLSSLRHELRTPLNAIIGYSEMLLEDAEHGGLEDLIPDLQKIRTAGRDLLAVINDILDSARTVDSKMDTRPSMSQETIATTRSLENEADSVLADEGFLLVVDDDELNRDLLTRYLERQGHTIAVAENGRQALEMVKKHSFDMVLLDVMMPEMNGYQVLQRLKADATWWDIPVIMISALDEIDSVVRCIELGAEDYLPKPFDPVLLRARIGAGLEKKRLRDQEVEYLRKVTRLTDAAAAVEAGTFDPDSLVDVVARRDELGRLARVFQHMAREVYAREQRLKQQVQQLSIELDEARQARQVAEIAETEYFRQLQAKAQDLRKILDDL